MDVCTVERPEYGIDSESAIRLPYSGRLPHGIIEMSHEIEGLVQTSTNLALIKMQNEQGDDALTIVTSQRSSIVSQVEMVGEIIDAVFFFLGGVVTHRQSAYPGWDPHPESPILQVACESYRTLYDTD